MEWKPEYSIGIEDIDRQHRGLVDCITLVEESVKSGDRWSAVHFATLQLRDYTHVHFAVEETVMKLIKYPQTEAHIREHHEFLRRLAEFEQNSLSNTIQDDMLGFLGDWFVNHILKVDRDYSRYIANRYPELIPLA